MENDDGKCIPDYRNNGSVKLQCGRMQHGNEKVGHTITGGLLYSALHTTLVRKMVHSKQF